MEAKSFHTRTVEALVPMLKDMEKRLKEFAPVPFQHERLTDKRQAAARFDAMTQQQRRDLIRRVGLANVLQLGGKGDGSPNQ